MNNHEETNPEEIEELSTQPATELGADVTAEISTEPTTEMSAEESDELNDGPTTPPIQDQLPPNHKSGFVIVVGRPNVGKSTLMNSFLQQKLAIVSHRPQTTRVRQLGIITEESYQIVFVDTPGLIRKTYHKLDKFMLQTAQEMLTDGDILLWLVDGSETPHKQDRQIAAQLTALGVAGRTIVAINKSDLVKPTEVVERTDAYRALLPDAEWLFFSAQKGHGVPPLLNLIISKLPIGPRYYPEDQVTDLYIRDIAAEMIREQLLFKLNQEVPHGTAVLIDSFKEDPDGITRIEATIYVERDSHKGIVIGKKGQSLRRIGTAARKEIEKLVERKIFLQLWVKVEPKWRQDEQLLKRFGYSTSK